MTVFSRPGRVEEWYGPRWSMRSSSRITCLMSASTNECRKIISQKKKSFLRFLLSKFTLILSSKIFDYYPLSRKKGGKCFLKVGLISLFLPNSRFYRYSVEVASVQWLSERRGSLPRPIPCPRKTTRVRRAPNKLTKRVKALSGLYPSSAFRSGDGERRHRDLV